VRFRVTPPELLPDLVEFLEERVNLVVQQAGAGEVAVSVLGSFADGGAGELDEYLEQWSVAHPDVAVARIADDSSAPPLLDEPLW
jgi:hypothetical protein